MPLEGNVSVQHLVNNSVSNLQKMHLYSKPVIAPEEGINFENNFRIFKPTIKYIKLFVEINLTK